MTISARGMRILAADIGATNSRFALFSADFGEEPSIPFLNLEAEQWLVGADWSSFEDVLNRLRQPGDGLLASLSPEEYPDHVVIAPAGPILNGTCRISNLPWYITSASVRRTLGIERVTLINDFAAQAYACLTPENIEAVPILPGHEALGAPIAVVGAGTGFGKALLLSEPESSVASKTERLARLARAIILPSEGGHSDFPFIGPEEYAFAEFARDFHAGRQLIGDTVVTGVGLAALYAYHTGVHLHPHEATAAALEQPVVLEWFARFYGRICRNYALETLSLGGMYITGGMALRVPTLAHPAFAAEFRTSLTQHELLRRIPVYHVRKPQAGLWGAALAGLLESIRSA